MKADTFGLPVTSMRTSEAASLGAAMLAAMSIGAFKDMRQVVESMVHIKLTYYTDEKQNQLYSDKYQQYKQLYPTLKNYNNLISRN